MRDDAWIIAVALTAAMFAFTQSACQNTGAVNRIAPPEVVDDPAAAASSSVPASFLATDFAPLATWFEERFEVEYRNMTPALVFDQDPIGDIRYDTQSMPANPPLFHLQNSNISRREILHRIAEFWGLTMEIEEVDGKPSVVVVRGLSASSPPPL